MEKEILRIIIKVVVSALTLISAYLGVISLASCTYSRSSVAEGRAIVVTVDTTYINHQGMLKTK